MTLRTRALAVAVAASFAVPAAISAGPEAAAAEVAIDCTRDGSLYACTLPTDNPVLVPVSFDQILDGVRAAGGSPVADPAMWITGWGGGGSNGSRIGSGSGNFDGGTGASGGSAQIAVSPATFAQVFGTSSFHYSLGQLGTRGPGDSSYGGWGGGATVVSATPPSVATPGQPPPLWDVVLVAGGGGGGGGGGSDHSGRSGGRGGVVVSDFVTAKSAAGVRGSSGGAGNGYGGGDANLTGTGGAGGCGEAWCHGADGVGGFGGFGGNALSNASSNLYNPVITPGSGDGSTAFHQVPLRSPGAGGGVVRYQNNNTGIIPCGKSQIYLACGGGGGAGFGGGGAGDWKDDDGAGGLGGGGGGSYVAASTCDANGAPSVGSNDGHVVVHVDPAQDCSASLAMLAARQGAPADATAELSPATATDLADVVSPAPGTTSSIGRPQVVVRLADGATITSARLNGRDVTAQLHQSGGQTWRGRLGPDDGVVIGENTLVVKAERGPEQWYESTHWIHTSRARSQLVDIDVVDGGQALYGVVSRLGDDPVLTSYTLNGHDLPSGHVTRDLGPDQIRLSASTGLRHGVNRLAVTAHTTSGQLQRATETIRISSTDPIAGAGPDQRVHVHGRIRLDGSSSQPPRREKHQTLEHQWTLFGVPSGSSASLSGADTATPEFRADRPGRYIVLLTVTGRNGRTSTDAVTVTVEALPNAVIDTLATDPNGNPGVQLDSAWFCPAGSTDTSCNFQPNVAQTNTQVQLLVLYRDTLEVYRNESYALTKLDDLAKEISQLTVSDGNAQVPDSGKLVVVTLGSGTVTDMTNFSDAVVQIGMPAYPASVQSVAGPFSIVGIPGMTSGKAWNNFGREIGGGLAGSLVGYLKDSAFYSIESDEPQTGQRVFTFADVVNYKTRVVDGANVEVQLEYYDPSTRVYTATTLATFPTTGGGIGVVTFDPYTLAAVEAKKWTPDTPAIDWDSVKAQLQKAIADGDGAVIVSLGQMSGYTSEPTAADFQNGVLPAIRELGGQPDVFARAVNDNGTYSFVGSGGQGVESSSILTAGVPVRAGEDGTTPLPVTAGTLTGELRRAPDGRFIPSQGDPNALYRSEFNPVAYQAPSAWPLTPEAGATSADGAETALAWLAQCQLLAGGDVVVANVELWPGQDCATDTTKAVSGIPASNVVRQVALSLRTDYYDNVNLAFRDFGALQYGTLFSSGNSVFTAADFTAAQSQLESETADLAAAKAFFGNMAATLDSGEQAGAVFTAMNQVAMSVWQTYFAQEKTMTVTDYSAWSQAMSDGFLTGATTIATVFDDPVLSVTNAFQIAGLFGSSSSFYQTLINGPNTSAITDLAAWVLLTEQLLNTTLRVDQQILQVTELQKTGFPMALAAVASDWGRLNTVAANSQNAWAMSADDLNDAANLFSIPTRQQTWQGFASQLWDVGSYPSSFSATNFLCTQSNTGKGARPFLGAVQSGTPTGLGHGIQYWPVQTISTATSAGGRNYPTWIPYIMWEKGTNIPAPAATVEAIFAQPTTEVPDGGGAYGPWFWPEVFELTKELAGCSTTSVSTKAGSFYGDTG